MKIKIITTSIFLAVLLTLSLSIIAISGPAYSHAKGDFYVFQERAPEDAGGFAIINYDKELGNWQVTLQLHDLLPSTTYYFSVGMGGTQEDTIITSIIIDDDGRFSFHGVVNNLPASYNIMRIRTIVSGKISVLTAPESDGSLKFRGINRWKE